jgi:RNA polymerase sigma-70 factor (family 1)
MVDHPPALRDRSGAPGPAATLTPPAEASSDQVLAAAIRAGDEVAFEALFRAFSRRLFVFADGYVHSAETAEDIVADVFVRVWERRAELELRGSWQSYLYTATRNRALRYLDHQKVVRRVHAEADGGHPLGLGRGPAAADADAQAQELAEAIDRAIALLPERTREAFVLHRKHGLSYAETAQAMGIAPRTVEVLIRRALKALRANLDAFLPLLLAAFL